MEDTPSLINNSRGTRSSPFSSNESPFVNSSPRVSMDDNDYGYDGQDYDDYEPMETTTPASRSTKKTPGTSGGRRVSFGDGTKVGGASSNKSRTPGSSRSSAATTPEPNQSMISTPGSNEFTRGRVIKDDTYINDDDDDEEEEEDEDTDSEGDTSADRSFLSEIKKRKNQMDIDDDDEDDEEDTGARRSKRATKGQKFAFWKNERPVYQRGELVGRIAADPTPRKPKKKDERFKLTKLKKIRENEMELPVIVPKNISYIDREVGDELSVWDDEADAAKITRCVCYRETLEPASALPITAVRPKGKEGVAYAAQSFNVAENSGVMSGWISGFVELPPGSIKDAEGVGECTQVFFISDCQDESIEIGVASPDALEWNDKTAQRQLLKKGDSFYVPSGNIYRLENHSQTKSCFIYWTIIKPLEVNNSR